jgi:hypothetical protein
MAETTLNRRWLARLAKLDAQSDGLRRLVPSHFYAARIACVGHQECCNRSEQSDEVIACMQLQRHSLQQTLAKLHTQMKQLATDPAWLCRRSAGACLTWAWIHTSSLHAETLDGRADADTTAAEPPL